MSPRSPPHIWLRAETKKNEKRTALTPAIAKQLVTEHGFKVTIEKSLLSIFDNGEYEQLGLFDIVESGSWKTSAPADAYIYGLKELPENDTSPLSHAHIMFAHCYKQQAGWKDVLTRFKSGNGTLLDLEFLVDERGRRVAAFGYYAGFAGSAVGIDVWCHRAIHGNDAKYPSISPYPNEDALISDIRTKLVAAARPPPKILVIGALGRCGSGACDFAVRAGIPEENIIRWDMHETKAGGPFPEILDVDIFVNCIYLSTPIPPFLTNDFIKAYDTTTTSSPRPLSVIVDVSCDATNPHNPIPVYYGSTTFDSPIVRVATDTSTPLDVVAIDHLPTLLPREASEFFAKDLLPSLIALKDYTPNASVGKDAQNDAGTDSQDKKNKMVRVWTDAEALFHKHAATV